MSGTLYVVATPLGHLGDLSARAGEVLRAVDVVAAEDTRRSRTLLRHVGARCRVVSVHQHAPAARLQEIIDALAGGATVALVTDAGTPAVSDPGARLVSLAHATGVPVRTIPGPSAVPAALSVSGLPADRYTFLGFLPRKGAERRRVLDIAAATPWTLVLFEAANRLPRLLSDLADRLGDDRAAVVTRELTKVHEDVKSGTLRELAGYYDEHSARGEITLLVAGGAPPQRPEPTAVDAASRAHDLLAQGLSRKDAAARLARELHLSRNEAYRLITEL